MFTTHTAWHPDAYGPVQIGPMSAHDDPCPQPKAPTMGTRAMKLDM